MILCMNQPLTIPIWQTYLCNSISNGHQPHFGYPRLHPIPTYTFHHLLFPFLRLTVNSSHRFQQLIEGHLAWNVGNSYLPLSLKLAFQANSLVPLSPRRYRSSGQWAIHPLMKTTVSSCQRIIHSSSNLCSHTLPVQNFWPSTVCECVH